MEGKYFGLVSDIIPANLWIEKSSFKTGGFREDVWFGTSEMWSATRWIDARSISVQPVLQLAHTNYEFMLPV
jgi:hypothetical protein